jgi:methyl-accepting chemotaxis protein
MSEVSQSSQLGRKIWYTAAIVLSGIVLLLSAAVVFGSWVLMDTLGDISETMLGAVDRSAGGVRMVFSDVDDTLGEIQVITDSIVDSRDQLSQAVSDQGLLMTLLPEEQTDNLVALSEQVEQTINTIGDVASSIVSLYRSINRLPLVNLPSLEQDEIETIEADINQVRDSITELRQGIEEFRSGAASTIDRLTQPLDRVSSQLEQSRNHLVEVDQQLAELQERAQRLQDLARTVFVLLAVFSTLFLAYVGYTQVEVIRLYLGRWKALGNSSQPAAMEEPTPEPEQDPGTGGGS